MSLNTSAVAETRARTDGSGPGAVIVVKEGVMMRVGVVFTHNRVSSKTWMYSPCVCRAASDHCKANWGRRCERVGLIDANTSSTQWIDWCAIVFMFVMHISGCWQCDKLACRGSCQRSRQRVNPSAHDSTRPPSTSR